MTPAPKQQTPSRAFKGWWAALLVPGLARLAAALASREAVAPGRALSWLAPGALVLGWAEWVHRRSAPRAAWRLRRDLHLPLMVTAAGALAAAAACLQPWNPDLERLLPLALAAGFLPALGVAAFVEEEPGTLAAWLTQPLPRWRLVAERAGVLALLAVALTAQALAVSDAVPNPEVFVMGLALALGLAPVVTLWLRSGAMAVPVVAVLSVILCVAAGDTVDAQLTLTRETVLTAAAGVLLAPWLAFARRYRTLPIDALPDLDPRRLWRVQGRTPRGTLLRKELRMQLPAVGIALLALPLWLLMAVFEGHPGEAGGPAILLGLTVALLAGVIPLASETEYGTACLDAAVLPRAQVWRTKLAVSLAVALVMAVAWPALLMALAAAVTPPEPGRGSPPLVTPQSLGPLFVWVALAVATWAAGLAASSVARRALTASFLGLGLVTGLVALQVALFTGAFWAGMVWSGPELRPLAGHLTANSRPDAFAAAPAVWAQAAGFLLLAAPLAVMAVVLARAARQRWLRGAEPVRVWALRGLVLAAVAAAGGVSLGLML